MSALKDTSVGSTTPAPAEARPARAIWGAATVAAVCLLGAGFAYRALAHYLDRAPEQLCLPPGALAQLSLEIGDWVGEDEPIEDSIVRVAAVDDYINRRYVRTSDNQAVGLWVAFGVRARDLMPHRPEVCFPGAGWTLLDSNTKELQLSGGGAIRARIMTFASGGLKQHRLTALNYYIVDDQTCEDVSLLRSKAWRGQASIRYMAQIQITCRQNPARRSTLPAEAVCEFAAESYGPIRNLLEGALESAGAANELSRP